MYKDSFPIVGCAAQAIIKRKIKHNFRVTVTKSGSIFTDLLNRTHMVLWIIMYETTLAFPVPPKYACFNV